VNWLTVSGYFPAIFPGQMAAKTSDWARSTQQRFAKLALLPLTVFGVKEHGLRLRCGFGMIELCSLPRTAG
jgi:hypothetical protein